MVDLSKDLPIQGMENSTSFNSRLTNLLLWMQRLLLESLLNVYLLFYAPHVSLLVFLLTDIFHRQSKLFSQHSLFIWWKCAQCHWVSLTESPSRPICVIWGWRSCQYRVTEANSTIINLNVSTNSTVGFHVVCRCWRCWRGPASIAFTQPVLLLSTFLQLITNVSLWVGFQIGLSTFQM